MHGGLHRAGICAGVPTVVARRMMQSSGLVGRLVESAGEAAAAAADGASLVILADVRASPSANEHAKPE